MDPNPLNNDQATADPNLVSANPPSTGLPSDQPVNVSSPQPQPANPEMVNDLGSQAVEQQASGVPIPNVANNNLSPTNNFSASANNQMASGSTNPTPVNQPQSNVMSSGLPPATDQNLAGNPMPTPDSGTASPTPESTPTPVPMPGAQPNPAQQPLATGSSSKSSGKSFWLILGGLVFVLVVLGVLLLVL